MVATYFARDGLLVAGSRIVAKADAARAAIAAVVDGPNAAERAAGYTTAIPVGTVVRRLAVAGRKAEVDLSNAFTTGGGSLSIRLRVAQIVYTLARTGTVDSVRFLIEGRQVDAIGGEGFVVTEVAIGEFDDLLPPIVVEFPTPGAKVASPFSFNGLANVFEGHVSYELVDARSTILTKGFATGMMGAWGQFATSVSFTSAGPLVLKVFTISPKDGSRRDESSIAVIAT